MNLSDYGLQFIAAWEGIKLRKYDDGGPGVGNCTIGVGRLIHLDPCDGRASEAPYAGGITYAQAYAFFRQDVASRVAWVNQHTTRFLTQGEFDACVDFTYNCGVGAFLQIVGVVNARGNFAAAIWPWSREPAWARDALTARRNAEARLYYGGTPATPPMQQVPEDEMWHRHNEIANNGYWVAPPGQIGRHTFGPGERATVQLAVDLPRVMAKTPSAIDLDIYTVGDVLEVRDGNGAFAGNCDALRRNDVIRVVPVNGAIQMWATGGPVTVLLGVRGYLD